MFQQAIVLLAIFVASHAAEVKGVFTTVSHLDKGGNSWVYYRRIHAKWAIKQGQLKPKDTFTLHTPCVQPFDPFDLLANGHAFANCVSVNDGTAASMAAKCTATDQVARDVSAFGDVAFPLYYGLGGSATPLGYDLGGCRFIGNNKLSFYEGDNAANPWVLTDYLADNPGSDSVSKGAVGTTLTGLRMAYGVEYPCANGYNSGTFSVSLDRQIYCDTVTYGMASAFNAFGFPKAGKLIPGATVSCANNKVTLSYSSIPAGYRPFIYTNFDANLTRTITVGGRYTCVGGFARTSNYRKTFYAVKLSRPDYYGTEIARSTTTGTWTQDRTTTIGRGSALTELVQEKTVPNWDTVPLFAGITRSGWM